MADEFARLLDIAKDRRLPPVSSWNPERVGEIDIRIRADGVWFHEGAEIKRRAIAKVFSTILRLEDGEYYLVTPGEKLRIVVEDAPFVAIDMETRGEGRDRSILFSTNCDDHVVADAEHPITVVEKDREPRPYVEVRDGLRALITRSVFYRLVELVDDPYGEEYWVWSAGTAFLIGKARVPDTRSP